MKRSEVVEKRSEKKAQERSAWVSVAVFNERAGWYSDGKWCREVDGDLVDIPEYASGIAEAWLVTEQFVSCKIEALPGFGYRVTVTNNEGIDVEACCDTAPEAICLAALIAVLVDEDEESVEEALICAMDEA